MSLLIYWSNKSAASTASELELVFLSPCPASWLSDASFSSRRSSSFNPSTRGTSFPIIPVFSSISCCRIAILKTISVVPINPNYNSNLIPSYKLSSSRLKYPFKTQILVVDRSQDCIYGLVDIFQAFVKKKKIQQNICRLGGPERAQNEQFGPGKNSFGGGHVVRETLCVGYRAEGAGCLCEAMGPITAPV